MQEIKIVWFNRNETEKMEAQLTALVNEGWVIISSGGTGGGGGLWGGFIILQREAA
jgi:hypothetical protein